MRKRYQHGSLRKVGRSWVAQWWENGRRRKETLGYAQGMSRAQAQIALAAKLAPLNQAKLQSTPTRFGEFVDMLFLPFYRRKWKESTASTTEERIRHHLVNRYKERHLTTFTRTQLQDFLDEKADQGLSTSTVDHLRWDLKQVFRFATAEGLLERNPADLLFTPRNAKRSHRLHMTSHEVASMISVLDTRERLITELAVIVGMRPGEIFALQWQHVMPEGLRIRQRVYRGQIDTPKTRQSHRDVALSGDLLDQLGHWRESAADTSPTAWVFPSENPATSMSRDNCLRRDIRPKLKPLGLGWVNFQVMRRTHSSLMRELGADPKLVADQLGHSLDVNLNVYTMTSLRARCDAVNRLQLVLNGASKELPTLLQ